MEISGIRFLYLRAPIAATDPSALFTICLDAAWTCLTVLINRRDLRLLLERLCVHARTPLVGKREGLPPSLERDLCFACRRLGLCTRRLGVCGDIAAHAPAGIYLDAFWDGLRCFGRRDSSEQISYTRHVPIYHNQTYLPVMVKEAGGYCPSFYSQLRK